MNVTRANDILESAGLPRLSEGKYTDYVNATRESHGHPEFQGSVWKNEKDYYDVHDDLHRSLLANGMKHVGHAEAYVAEQRPGFMDAMDDSRNAGFMTARKTPFYRDDRGHRDGEMTNFYENGARGIAVNVRRDPDEGQAHNFHGYVYSPNQHPVFPK
jgi:hypothetical protein